MHSQGLAAVAACLATLAIATPIPNTTVQDPGVHSNPYRRKTLSAAASEETEYDSNWAGSIVYPPSGVSFTAAVGNFIVPSCSDPGDGSEGPWSASFWVGIDGVSGSNDILQSGASCTANTDGSTSYHVWQEYYPAPETAIPDFTINEGDSITITLNVDSSTSGTIVIADNTSGQTTTTSVTAPTPTATIAGISAEWIVEDFSSGGGLVPFASFSPVTFSGSSATGSDGNVYTAAESDFETIDIENSSGTVITSVAANGDDSLTTSYTG